VEAGSEVGGVQKGEAVAEEVRAAEDVVEEDQAEELAVVLRLRRSKM
jgi:hypothetical protein